MAKINTGKDKGEQITIPPEPTSNSTPEGTVDAPNAVASEAKDNSTADAGQKAPDGNIQDTGLPGGDPPGGVGLPGSSIEDKMAPYLAAYPDELVFFITSDEQVFLSASENEARNHQRGLDFSREPAVYFRGE